MIFPNTRSKMIDVDSCPNIGEPPSNLKYFVIIDSEKYREGKMKRFF